MGKDVMILTGAGQIGMAIARRMGYGMKIVVGDKNKANAEAIARTMNGQVLMPCHRFVFLWSAEACKINEVD